MSRRNKNKNRFPTEPELIGAILRLDRSYLHQVEDEQLSRIFEDPDYKALQRAESLYRGRGRRKVNTPFHLEGLEDLETASLLLEFLNEVSAIHARRVKELRSIDEWEFNFLSPYMRKFQVEQAKFLEVAIPFDVEHFNTVYCYSNDQLRYLLHLASHSLLPENVIGLLSHREVVVDPWIWKKRREVSAAA